MYFPGGAAVEADASEASDRFELAADDDAREAELPLLLDADEFDDGEAQDDTLDPSSSDSVVDIMVKSDLWG